MLGGLIGDKAILVAMKTNEDDTNTAYERAVNHEQRHASARTRCCAAAWPTSGGTAPGSRRRSRSWPPEADRRGMAGGPILLGPHRAKLAGPGYVKLAEPPESALALAVCELARDAGAAGCLYVARSEARAERLARAVSGFAPDIQVIVLPAWDCLPYDRFSPSPSIMARRIAALRDMTRPRRRQAGWS